MLVLEVVRKLGKRVAKNIRLSVEIDKWLTEESMKTLVPKNAIIQDILETYRHEKKSWQPHKKR